MRHKERLPKGFRFLDSYLQNGPRKQNIYEEIPDQEKATQDVKNMENDGVMDELICGSWLEKLDGNSCSFSKAATDGNKSRFWFRPRFWRSTLPKFQRKIERFSSGHFLFEPFRSAKQK